MVTHKPADKLLRFLNQGVQTRSFFPLQERNLPTLLSAIRLLTIMFIAAVQEFWWTEIIRLDMER